MAEEPRSTPPSAGEASGWRGFEVDEIGGGALGKVHGFFTDALGGEPTWLIARLGRRRTRLVAVPVCDCAAGGGRVWVAHGRDVIRSAPVVEPTRPLLREHELAISAHFGISERIGRAAEVAIRPERAITSKPMR
jgi:hypothetical protein